tara:strand:+ start:14823 stop:15185 length:363 start_codon:yes stop_codon:yes gene_type:complete
MDNLLLKRKHFTRHLAGTKGEVPVLSQPLLSLDPRPSANTSSILSQMVAARYSVLKMAGVVATGVIILLFVLDPPFIHQTTKNDIVRGDINTTNVLSWSLASAILVIVIALYKSFTHHGK